MRHTLVVPAKAGTQSFQDSKVLDSRLRGNDVPHEHRI
jgi:hypothetical protein